MPKNNKGLSKMMVYDDKHIYIEDYPEMEIYNIELDTDEETYFDVNINLKQKWEIISAATAATHQCRNF